MLMPHEAAHLVASRAIPLLQQHSRLGAAVRLLRAALPLLITRPLPPFSRNSARAEGAAHEEAGGGGEEYCDSARVREHLQALSGVIAYYGAQDVLTSRERMSLLSLSIEWCEAVPARQVCSIMCLTHSSLTDMRTPQFSVTDICETRLLLIWATPLFRQVRAIVPAQLVALFLQVLKLRHLSS